CRGQRVPLAAPEKREHEGHRDEIGGRTVRVAARIAGLAPAVGLHPVATLSVCIGGTAGACRVLDWHVPPRRFAVEDPVPTDHARETDVDDPMWILDVEADADATEEDGDCGEEPDRPRKRRIEGSAAKADPRSANGDVGEWRCSERGRAEDVALVEAPQGN